MGNYVSYSGSGNVWVFNCCGVSRQRVSVLDAGPIASALTNRFGCRPVCIVGGVIASASFFLASFSQTIDQLMITYGVMAGAYIAAIFVFILHISALYVIINS